MYLGNEAVHEKLFWCLGDNGTVDGQGEVWWEIVRNKSLDYSRGPLVELVDSTDIIISNLTFTNSPFWNIHPVYCRLDPCANKHTIVHNA